MSSTPTRRLALPALALVGVLGLAACGDTTDTAGTTGTSTSSNEHGGGHSGGSAKKGNDADVAFLKGMKPHHEQAVEMSDIVLAANPPAGVAAIARQVKQAQAPEIEQMDTMLDALGQDASAGQGGGHGSGHGGMMSAQDMADLKAATGNEAARLYLEAMIAHHEGAIEASDAEIADGDYAPAVELAKTIKAAQTAEITEMRALLQSL